MKWTWPDSIRLLEDLLWARADDVCTKPAPGGPSTTSMKPPRPGRGLEDRVVSQEHVFSPRCTEELLDMEGKYQNLPFFVCLFAFLKVVRVKIHIRRDSPGTPGEASPSSAGDEGSIPG